METRSLSRVFGGAAEQVAGDGAFGNLKAEFQQFAMDSRRAPGRILPGHALDQFEDVGLDPSSAQPGDARAEAPIEAEPGDASGQRFPA